MNKNIQKMRQQIIYYFEKLNPIRQIEALDFIKWLWGGLGKEENFGAKEIEKISSLSRKRGGKKFNTWEKAKKYLENLA